MSDKSLQFLEKLDSLSDEVRLYFNSAEEATALTEIQKDYQLSGDNLDDLIRDIFIANFDFKVLDSGLKKTKVPVSSQSKLAADILGKIFLPVESYLKLDVKAEIIKRGHRPEIYQDYADDLIDLIEDQNFQNLEELAELHKEVNPVEEEGICLDLFTTGLKGVLNDTGVESVTNLNGGLINLLTNKPDFHNKITKTLLANQEQITTQNITWPEGVEKGTVANWLKDFIKENGSDIYNSVVLSRYLATSANPQLLSEDERRLVRRLLRLYRNLVFFPDSMNDVPAEDWEIVPVDKVSVEKPIPSFNPKTETPPVVEEKVAEVIAPVIEKVAAPVAKKAPIKKAPVVQADPVVKIGADLKDSKLASMLTKYSPDSLEARVVKEEIKRRQNNI